MPVVENVGGVQGAGFFFYLKSHLLPIIWPSVIQTELWNLFTKQHDTKNQKASVS